MKRSILNDFCVHAMHAYTCPVTSFFNALIGSPVYVYPVGQTALSPAPGHLQDFICIVHVAGRLCHFCPEP